MDVVSSLPRLNRRLHLLSSNLADYSFFSCPDPADPTVNLNTSMCSINAEYGGGDVMGSLVSSIQSGGASDKDPWAYLESGPVLYAAIGLASALFCIAFTFFYCCCRTCCCCVKGGCCGRRYPTYAGEGIMQV